MQDSLRIHLTLSSHVIVTPYAALATTLFYGGHCDVNAMFPMRCHNEIQWALKDCARKCLSLPNQAVHLKAYAGTTAGTDLVTPKRVTDEISVIVGAETLWIDVSVMDPGCQHYIRRYRSNEVPDTAA